MKASKIKTKADGLLTIKRNIDLVINPMAKERQTLRTSLLQKVQEKELIKGKTRSEWESSKDQEMSAF